MATIQPLPVSLLRLGFSLGAVATLASARLPAMFDRDGDGLSDVWTALHPAAGAAADDPDGDGADNRSESLAGTDPTSCASRFTAATERDASGNLVLRWAGVAGKRYQVERSVDLLSWTQIPEALLGTGEWCNVVVRPANATGLSREYWRVAVADLDSDGDGFNDWEELQLGTDPALATSVPPVATEFGRGDWTDTAFLREGPPADCYFGCWTHVAAPVGAGTKGNDYPFVVECSETVAGERQLNIMVSGNMGYDIGAGSWYYNQNIMTNTGDHVTWYAHGDEAALRGWVYNAWHFQRVGTATIATQYLRVGLDGPMEITSQETLPNETCTPSVVHVGGGPRCSGTVHLQYSKIYAMPTAPSVAQAEAIALRRVPDPAAWADWPLRDGDTADVSGHGRHLTVEGQLHRGVIGPLLPP